MAVATKSFACGSDAQCRPDQICNDQGVCVPDGRDWTQLKKSLLEVENRLEELKSKRGVGGANEGHEIIVHSITDGDVVDPYSLKFDQTSEPSEKSNAICGLLRFSHRDSVNLYFKGVGAGGVTVNFSKNGRITSRMFVRVVHGGSYGFGHSGVSVGFSCH
jgi:hypothetical protein